eukprot:gene27298-biopygen17809
MSRGCSRAASIPARFRSPTPS